MILELLPILDGWDSLNLSDTITLNQNETKYIALPNSGLITYALITTTSEYTNIKIGQFSASPTYLNTAGLYKTRPVGLESLEPPYTILFAPLQPIPYEKNTRITLYEPLSGVNPTVTYIITGIQIIDKESFKESLKEILGNPATLPRTTEHPLEKNIIELINKQNETTTNLQDLLNLLKEISQKLTFFR